MKAAKAAGETQRLECDLGRLRAEKAFRARMKGRSHAEGSEGPCVWHSRPRTFLIPPAREDWGTGAADSDIPTTRGMAPARAGR